MRKRAFLCLIFAALTVVCACSGSSEPIQTETFVMNTFLTQTIYGNKQAAESNEQIARGLENKLSRTLDGSEIRLLMEADGMEMELSVDTANVLAASLDAQAKTNGAYDPFLGSLRDLWGFGSDEPAVPSGEEVYAALAHANEVTLTLAGNTASATGMSTDYDLDLGGAAKGYALDCMNANLETLGINDALIDFGGALLVKGTKPTGPWLVGVRDPLGETDGSIAQFAASDVLIETSGISEQNFTSDGVTYHHLLNPATGYPAENELASVTVASESGTEADIYATALFVMGLEDGLQFANDAGLQVLFITKDRELVCSDAFSFDLKITNDAFHLRWN